MKKGITPVVAIVLLLLLTIAAAGAAFVFTRGVLGQQQQRTRETAAASLNIAAIQCDADNGYVNVTASNTGNIDLTGASVAVRDPADNTVVGTDTSESAASDAWTEGNSGTKHFDIGGSTLMSAGDQYNVEVTFDNVDFSSGDACVAQ